MITDQALQAMTYALATGHHDTSLNACLADLLVDASAEDRVRFVEAMVDLSRRLQICRHTIGERAEFARPICHHTVSNLIRQTDNLEDYVRTRLRAKEALGRMIAEVIEPKHWYAVQCNEAIEETAIRYATHAMNTTLIVISLEGGAFLTSPQTLPG